MSNEPVSRGVLQTIRILKAGGPLGLSIVGGVDHTSHPFGVHEPGVFVSKVSGISLLFNAPLLLLFVLFVFVCLELRCFLTNLFCDHCLPNIVKSLGKISCQSI